MTEWAIDQATQEPIWPWSPTAGAYWRRSTLSGSSADMRTPRLSLAASCPAGAEKPPTVCGTLAGPPRAGPGGGGARRGGYRGKGGAGGEDGAGSCDACENPGQGTHACS